MTIAELRAEVFLRDGMCVLALLIRHQCADQWGTIHEPDDLDSLTLGHVREHAGGKRRDEYGWTIAQCGRSNDQHEESANAAIVRAYLEGVRRAAERCPEPRRGTGRPAITIPPGAMRRIELEEAMA